MPIQVQPQFDSMNVKSKVKFPKWAKLILAILILFVFLIIALNAYSYFFTVHDVKTCRKAGGQSGVIGEAFYCKLDGKYYWGPGDIVK